ncbi:hypothetical protein Glove_220g40 [Diversispora epigaea]|uniref:Uncharacterized protein n=1 Tax=Diversispora epigaea TaxID=1348612 RepID=A0A397IIE1_9GLOM|nr:hypothetical protein Glove_220g40 [Diversispora epigaea]
MAELFSSPFGHSFYAISFLDKGISTYFQLLLFQITIFIRFISESLGRIIIAIKIANNLAMADEGMPSALALKSYDSVP